MTDEEIRAVKKQTRPAAYAGLISVITAVIVMVICIVFTIHTGNDAERYARRQAQLLCAMLVTLDNAYHSATPTTEVGRHLAQDVHNLRTSLDC